MPPHASSLVFVEWSRELGDSKRVGSGVMEMRIDYGPGYQVYYVMRGKTRVILLCAGDKRTQARDIRRAQALARELTE
jgi:putative addiction module killer protein